MTADRIIAAATALLAAAYLAATWRMPSLEIGDPLGPKAFPILLGVTMLVAALLLVIETFGARQDDGAKPPGLAALATIAGVLAWLAVYVMALQQLGYLISTALFLFALMVWFDRKRPVGNTLSALLFALGSYALFDKLLGTSLPAGLLGF